MAATKADLDLCARMMQALGVEAKPGGEEGCIGFLRTANFGERFHWEQFRGVYRLAEGATNRERFENKELTDVHARLTLACQGLLLTIRRVTTPDPQDYYTITDTDAGHRRARASELRTTADAVVKAFDEFNAATAKSFRS